MKKILIYLAISSLFISFSALADDTQEIPGASDSFSIESTSGTKKARPGLRKMSKDERRQWLKDHPGARKQIKDKMRQKWQAMSEEERATWRSEHPKADKKLRKKWAENNPGKAERIKQYRQDRAANQ